jgi:hypothetical protein
VKRREQKLSVPGEVKGKTMKSWIAFWNILVKDMRNYYLHNEAVRLGTAIIQKEGELENTFKNGGVDSNKLKTLVTEIARLRSELRLVHLLAHPEMKGVLS